MPFHSWKGESQPIQLLSFLFSDLFLNLHNGTFFPISSTPSTARVTQFCLIQGPREWLESSVSIVWGLSLVSSERKRQKDIRRREKGPQRDHQGEIHKLPLLSSLGQMMIKSGLLKQTSYFRPQDVLSMKPILFQVGPIRNKSIWTFDASNVVTSKHNIKQPLNRASKASSEPEPWGWSCKEEKGDFGVKNPEATKSSLRALVVEMFPFHVRLHPIDRHVTLDEQPSHRRAKIPSLFRLHN